jgi:hypothetical protein
MPVRKRLTIIRWRLLQFSLKASRVSHIYAGNLDVGRYDGPRTNDNVRTDRYWQQGGMGPQRRTVP